MAKGEYHRMGGPADDPGPSIRFALTEGSHWRGYHHGKNADLGDITILSHRRKGIECYVQSVDMVLTMPWPPNNGWTIQGDHIRVFNPDTRDLIVSYAPAN